MVKKNETKLENGAIYIYICSQCHKLKPYKRQKFEDIAMQRKKHVLGTLKDKPSGKR